MKDLIRKFLTDRYFVKERFAFIEQYASNMHVLNIGCGVNPYGSLFPNATNLDIKNYDCVNIKADAQDMHMIHQDRFDCVLCTEVLEHIKYPQKAIDEMYRVLKPGGTLILTTRFLFPEHSCPEDYYRFTVGSIKHLLQRFTIKELKTEGNLIGTVARIIQKSNELSKRTSLFLLVLAKLLFYLSKIIKREGAYSGIWVYCEK